SPPPTLALVSHAGFQVPRTCTALFVGVWSHCPTLSPQAASAVRIGVPQRDEKPLRKLGRNNGYGAGRLSVGSVAVASGKCLLLPGDNIIPNNLTMPDQLLSIDEALPAARTRPE